MSFWVNLDTDNKNRSRYKGEGRKISCEGRATKTQERGTIQPPILGTRQKKW